MEEKNDALLEMGKLEKDNTTPARSRGAITVLGTGDFGKALAKRLSLAGYDVVLGSRCPDTRRDSSVYTVMSIEDALNHSYIIFLAIPRGGYDQMVMKIENIITNKILIDVSNPLQASSRDISHAEYLANLLPTARVVKGFNVISAWALENDIYGGSRMVYICGDDQNAKHEVMEISRAIQFVPIDQGSLRMAKTVENKPLELFPSWRVALKMFGALYLLLLVYFIIGKLVKNPDFNNFPLRIISILNAFCAVGVLDMVYLPGCIAALLQLSYGTKYRRFPRWLDLWMKSRKQLGLIALTIAGMHGCMSALYWAPEYKPWLYQKTSFSIGNITLVQYGRMYAQGEAFLSLGVLAFTTMAILGVTSLPTVLNRMSWREWNFVQSGMGYFTLLCALLHFTILVYDKVHQWDATTILYPTVLVIVIGYVIILLKLVLLLPCIAQKVQKIRTGWERGRIVV